MITCGKGKERRIPCNLCEGREGGDGQKESARAGAFPGGGTLLSTVGACRVMAVAAVGGEARVLPRPGGPRRWRRTRKRSRRRDRSCRIRTSPPHGSWDRGNVGRPWVEPPAWLFFPP